MASTVSKNVLYRFAFSKITVIVLCAMLTAALEVSAANDLFAFVKPSEKINFELAEPCSLGELSASLQKAGVIENSAGFWLYAKLKNMDGLLEAFCGSVELNSDMSYRDILNKFKNI